MLNPLLEPLPTKLFDGELDDSHQFRDKSPFPYRNFSPLLQQEEPAPGVEPELQVDRLEQLEKMLAEKHAFDANMEREAYDKAYMSGEKAGLALGQKRAEQILEKMQQLQEQTQRQLDEIRNSMCEAVLDISGALTQWLVGEMTAEDRSRLLAMAEKAARSLPVAEKMVMVVHPGDFSQFEKLLVESDFHPKLLIDNTVTPGSIRIANEEQDILIDPSASIAEAVAQLKKDILAGDSVVDTA